MNHYGTVLSVHGDKRFCIAMQCLSRGSAYAVPRDLFIRFEERI